MYTMQVQACARGDTHQAGQPATEAPALAYHAALKRDRSQHEEVLHWSVQAHASWL